MANVIEVSDFRLIARIKEQFVFYLRDLEEETKEYYKKIISTVVVPSAAKVLSEKNYQKSFDELSYEEKVDFYNLLFSEVSRRLVEISPSTMNTSAEFKNELLQHMNDSRETDKDRIQFDEDIDYVRPDVSEYEFDLPRMMDDIEFFIRVRLENGGKTPRK